MNVLIACEESQRVCAAYRSKGDNAFSCDIQYCSGGHPEWHIKQDVLSLLDGRCKFYTCDGVLHTIDGKWDLIIAHPPCTYLSDAGKRYLNINKYGDYALRRLALRDKAVEFFMQFVNCDCDRVAIENPRGYMSEVYKEPSQIVQPYYFGDAWSKATCLWLRGLKPLNPTNIVKPEYVYVNGKYYSPWHINTFNLSKEERSRIRSKTPFGLACAMADQWR